MNLDDLPSPTISVGLDDLYADNNHNIIEPNSRTDMPLTIRPDCEKKSSLVVYDIPSSRVIQKPLELQNIDFMGPAEIVKALFTLPYADNQSFFALHKMGNTLLIDSVVQGDVVIGKFSPDETNEILNVQHTKTSTLATLCSPISNTANPWPQGGDMISHRIEGLLATMTTVPSSLQMTCVEDGNSAMDMSQRPQLYTSVFPIVTTSVPLHTGSPYLPPPGYFIPNSPQPCRQVLLWQLHEMRLAVASDLAVYRTETHPAITIKPMDTSRAVELSTCLDLYLDNVMANVPELALCMHAKGFIRGIRVLPTEHIPFLVGTQRPMPHRTPPTSTQEQQNFQKKKSHKKKKKNSHLSMNRDESGDRSSEETKDNQDCSPPMFDPKVIDFNASTILRFLKDNCSAPLAVFSKEDGTYIVRLSPDGDALHLYDLDAMSVQRQKRWKWMLAMLSYRFAVRLGHHTKLGSMSTKVQIRHRQKMLFSSCFQLLGEIRDLGGESHGTIRSSVLEQMADIHLSRVDDYCIARDRTKKNDGLSGSGALHEEEEEGFDVTQELQEAMSLLLLAIDTIDDTIRTGSVSFTSPQSSTATSPNDSPLHTPRSSSPLPSSLPSSTPPRVPSPNKAKSTCKISEATTATATGLGAHCPRDDHQQVDVEDEYEGFLVGDVPIAVSRGNSSSSNPEVLHPRKGDLHPSNYLDGARAGASSFNDGGSKSANQDAVMESLMMQFAGLFHKAVLCNCTWVDLLCRDAKTAEAVDVIGRLDSTCDLWTRLRSVNDQHRLFQSPHSLNYSPCSVLTSEEQTLLSVLPLLWASAGSLTREMARQLQRGSTGDSGRSFFSSISSQLPEKSYLPIEHKLSRILASIKKWTVVSQTLLTPSSSRYSKVGDFESSKGITSDLQEFMKVLVNGLPSNAAVQALCKTINISTRTLKSILGFELMSGCDPEEPFESSLWSCCHELHVTVPWVLVTSIALSVSALVLWRESLGPAADPRERARYSSFAQTPRGSVSLRRLAEASSVCGQQFLELTSKLKNINSCVPNSMRERDMNSFLMQLLDRSEAFLSIALALFGVCNDVSNQATVICNLCSLLRLKAIKIAERDVDIGTSFDGSGVTYVNHSKSIKRSESSVRKIEIEKYVAVDEAMKHLNKALDLSNKGHSILGQRGGSPLSGGGFGVSVVSQEKIWDAVSYEAGCVYLCIGVMLRSRYFPPSSSPSSSAEDPGSDCAKGPSICSEKLKSIELRILESLETALRIFVTLRSERQTAATHFQLGAMHMALAASASASSTSPQSSATPPSAGSGRDPDRLEHGLALEHYGAAHGYYVKFDVGPALLMLLTDTCDIYLSAFDAAIAVIGLPSSSSSSSSSEVIRHARERDLVSNLLGGAYHAMIESKCAFTGAVLERHGAVIGDLASRVSQRLATLILRLLQCESRKIFQAIVCDAIASSSTALQAVQALKLLYRELLQMQKVTSIPALVVCDDDSGGSGTGSGSGCMSNNSSGDGDVPASVSRIVERTHMTLDQIQRNEFLRCLFGTSR